MQWSCCMAVVVLYTIACCTANYAVNDGLPWWKTAIFYQVYPRSFQDSDGDGIGDLRGIVQRADYFKKIGVNAIWLSPIFESPMVDFGYDISNYTKIDPIFGTLDDFKALVKVLESVDVKLVIDFVPNHTSDKHTWFQNSVNKEEPYTNFYVWNDGKRNDTTGNYSAPNNWMSVFSGSAWQWNEQRQQYYFHDFVKEQPDLNFRNPNVTAKIEEVIRFWLDIGVDGFRIDSSNFLYEVENVLQDEKPLPGTDGSEWADYNHNCTQNQPETYALLQKWAQLFYEYSIKPGGKPRAIFLEAYTDLNHTIMYYGKGNSSLMQPFNFEMLAGNQSTRAPTIKKMIDDWMNALPKGTVPNWVLGNHDNGRLADRYGAEMTDVMNLLTGVLPGIKVVYNGAEIGMQDTFIRWDQTVDPSGKLLGPYKYRKASRDPERTPMQWDKTQSAGFSTNQITWLPVNPNYWWLNVEAQLNAEKSHLNVFKSLAQVRKSPVLQYGDLRVEAPDNDTLIVIRSYNKTYFALIMNFGSLVRNYTFQNLFASIDLNTDMQVVITSTNIEDYNEGDSIKRASLFISMRPKSAILLKSSPGNSPRSSAVRTILTHTILLIALLVAFFSR